MDDTALSCPTTESGAGIGGNDEHWIPAPLLPQASGTTGGRQ